MTIIERLKAFRGFFFSTVDPSEVEKWAIRNCGYALAVLDDAVDEISRLTAELDAMAIDAARYRWLRDKADHTHGPACFEAKGSGYGDLWLCGSDLDARVDQAMRGDE
jgi:hypothetical protein